MSDEHPSAQRRLANAALVGLVLAGTAWVGLSPAAAGTGRPWALSWAKDHPAAKSCSGDDCKADDPRSGSDCQGLICSFSSPKAMAPPMTATRADELARQQAEAAAAQPAAKPAAEAPAPAKPRKRLAKAKALPAPKTAAVPATDTTAAK